MKLHNLLQNVEYSLVKKKTKMYNWMVFTDDSLRRQLRFTFMDYIARRGRNAAV